MTTPPALVYHLRQAADRRFPRGSRPALAPSSDKRLARLYRQIKVELVPVERRQEAAR